MISTAICWATFGHLKKIENILRMNYLAIECTLDNFQGNLAVIIFFGRNKDSAFF